MTKLKELKRYAKNILPNNKKLEKDLEQRIVLGVKIIRRILGQKK